MKQLKLKFLLTLLMSLVGANAFAYNFKVNGIYYDFYGTSNNVLVVSGTNQYEGSVYIPPTVTYNGITYKVLIIGNHSFEGCAKLTSVYISNGVKTIGNSAFKNCEGLSSITIPSSVESIDNLAFEGCSGLKKVVVPDISAWCKVHFPYASSNPLHYAHHLYSDHDTEITNLVIPNDVTTIGDFAFCSCSSLISVTIPNSVTTIGRLAFSGCSGLTSIVIPNSVATIGSYAFNCSNLTSVTVENGTPVTISSEYTFTNRANATLYVPYGCKLAYKTANYWKEFKEIIELAPEDDHVIITIPSVGIRTFSSTYPLDFTKVSGLKAYIASGFNPLMGELTLTRVNNTPCATGLLLKAEAGDYEVPVAETDIFYSNLLKAVTTATNVAPTEGSYTNFILANGDKYGIGFYTLSESGVIASGRAYLQLPTSVLSAVETRGMKFVFDDEGTTSLHGISNVPSVMDKDVYYTLDGQKLSGKPTKSGLYIVNGKKVVMR